MNRANTVRLLLPHTLVFGPDGAVLYRETGELGPIRRGQADPTGSV